MSLVDKLKEKKRKMEVQIKRGKERTEQMKAEKQRRKLDNVLHMQPGARKTIKEGVLMKKKPLDVMKEEYYRRKQKRAEEKETVK